MLAMSEEEIFKEITAKDHSTIDKSIYLEELHRRRMLRQSKETTHLTKTVKNLTWWIFGLTAANVAVVAYSVLW